MRPKSYGYPTKGHETANTSRQLKSQRRCPPLITEASIGSIVLTMAKSAPIPKRYERARREAEVRMRWLVDELPLPFIIAADAEQLATSTSRPARRRRHGVTGERVAQMRATRRTK